MSDKADSVNQLEALFDEFEREMIKRGRDPIPPEIRHDVRAVFFSGALAVYNLLIDCADQPEGWRARLHALEGELLAFSQHGVQ
jgi:hypothetical protein